MNKSLETPVTEKSELFIGLVGAVGINLDDVFKNIRGILEKFNYNAYQIKISDFFYDPYFKEKYQVDIGKKSKNNTDIFQKFYSKIEDKQTIKNILEHNKFPNTYLKMEAGNQIRKSSGYSSILAMYTMRKVRRLRKQNNLESHKNSAYIFQSLKHPEESKLLSEAYGSGYYQIGVYSAEEERVEHLKKSMNEDSAKVLIKKDMDEENKPYGQKTRGTFQLSDFFIKQYPQQEKELERIFDLIFGHPYITPTLDEHMMYMAYTYSTRSADLSRQVGAVICNESKDVIGMGSNDVPRFGGGPYWPGDDQEDWRDYKYIQDEWKSNGSENRGKKGEDTNQINRDQIIEKIIKVFKDEIDGSFSKDKISEIKLKLLKEAGINDIKEFGRPTHAEVSAILNCTRNGISPQGGTIYCTTFPCHNCTRHIIDAGIQKVVFIEPYPSSKAKLLHCDSILVESSKSDKKKVTFEHFIGIAARRYLDLFSLKLGMGHPIKRKDKQGKTVNFNRKTTKIRVPLIMMSYQDKEDVILSKLGGLS